METTLKTYIRKSENSLFETLKALCEIPAPSHHEEKRAEFCKKWLESAGAKGVYIDKAKNVIFPINCEGSSSITVFAAHTDTVFPDTEPMLFTDKGETLHCPGIGDNTASLTILLLCAKYFIEHNIVPKEGVMFVCNSCEEGLGNLKGTRKLFSDFSGRIGKFISFDSQLGFVADRSVGSHRYSVEVTTEGGHSYLAFGNKNAIAELSSIISEIYTIELPKADNAKTTYNIGTVSGGTSVNTIAQSAKMLCEYRSDNKACLAYMEKEFERIFSKARRDGVTVNVERIGERPCMGEVDIDAIEDMTKIYADIVKETLGRETETESSSTDCNIPLSLGIPALCVGVYEGFGWHTREEFVKKESLLPGLEIGLKTVLKLCENL